MTPKKFTRGFFYALLFVGAVSILYMLTDIAIRHWDVASDVLLILGVCLGVLGLVQLARWAFSEEKPYPFQYKTMPPSYPVPDYFDSEEAGRLSDGRDATPLYNNGKFMGRVPQKPFLDERVGDYRWGKSHHGDWVWIYDPMIIETADSK